MPKWGKATFDDLLDLQRKMQWLSKTQIEKFTKECARELSQRLLAMVVNRTPVDTGTLRQGWKIDYKIVRKGDTYSIDVYNPVFYASFVEYGHRDKSHTKWIEGQYFMTKSEIDLERQIGGILEAKLIAKLKEVFND